MLQGLTFGDFHLHMQPDPVMLQYFAWKASCGQERHVFREIWSGFQPQDLISLQGIFCEGCVVTGTWNKLLVLLSSWCLNCLLELFGIHVYNSGGRKSCFSWMLKALRSHLNISLSRRFIPSNVWAYNVCVSVAYFCSRQQRNDNKNRLTWTKSNGSFHIWG